MARKKAAPDHVSYERLQELLSDLGNDDVVLGPLDITELRQALAELMGKRIDEENAAAPAAA